MARTQPKRCRTPDRVPRGLIDETLLLEHELHEEVDVAIEPIDAALPISNSQKRFASAGALP